MSPRSSIGSASPRCCSTSSQSGRRSTGRHVFDIDLLAGRLVEVTRWVRRRAELADLPIGYFGASTGAAAALVAAAELGDAVTAVVSRGGRPDLAGNRLSEVRTPTLLIVGGEDRVVLDLNRRADEMLGGPSRLVIIPGATHLFEESGTLDAAADAAASWFAAHFPAADQPTENSQGRTSVSS